MNSRMRCAYTILKLLFVSVGRYLSLRQGLFYFSKVNFSQPILVAKGCLRAANPSWECYPITTIIREPER